MADMQDREPDAEGTAPQAPEWIDSSHEEGQDNALPLVWLEDGTERPFEPCGGDGEPWLQVMGSMLADESVRQASVPKKPALDPEEEERRRMDNDLLKWV